MTFNDLTVKSAVESAINEFEEIGREAFLSKYGFGPARSYFLYTRVQDTTQKPYSMQPRVINLQILAH